MSERTRTTAQNLLVELSARGIEVMISPERSNRLRYSPKAAMTDDLVARLKSHKENILILLQETKEPQAAVPFANLPSNVSDRPEDWQYEYEERAAIIEYDGDLNRPEAEQWAETIVRAAYRLHGRSQ